MRVGVPKEIKNNEARVALLPSGAAAFAQHGHTVFVQHGAGHGSGIDDGAYRAAGARIVKKASALWERSDMIVKVKEPLGDELTWIDGGQILYTYLHLASNAALAKGLLRANVTAVGYETIQLDDGSLPLLIPEVA